MLKRDPANTAPAEEAFLTAIAIAQQQKARSFELRAALSLAKLYQSTGRAADAHAVLAPALEGFSPTPEFPEIEAGANAARRARRNRRSEEAAALRQRRLKLQTSYGQAMLMVERLRRRETKAAFAVAASLPPGSRIRRAILGLLRPVGRPVYPRRILAMREVAEAFMRDAERSTGN